MVLWEDSRRLGLRPDKRGPNRENRMTEYVDIDPREANASDEFRLNGTWHRAKSVVHTGSRIVVTWPQGGRMSGPSSALAGRVRRAVQA